MEKKNKQAMMQAATLLPQNARQKQVQENHAYAGQLNMFSRY